MPEAFTCIVRRKLKIVIADRPLRASKHHLCAASVKKYKMTNYNHVSGLYRRAKSRVSDETSAAWTRAASIQPPSERNANFGRLPPALATSSLA